MHTQTGDGGGGATPLCGYIRMCGSKGYGFLAILVSNSAPILAILVFNQVWYFHSSLELGMFV